MELCHCFPAVSHPPVESTWHVWNERLLKHSKNEFWPYGSPNAYFFTMQWHKPHHVQPEILYPTILLGNRTLGVKIRFTAKKYFNSGKYPQVWVVWIPNLQIFYTVHDRLAWALLPIVFSIDEMKTFCKKSFKCSARKI